MIAAAWFWLRIAVEVALACHCVRRLEIAVDEWRCVEPLEHPRCELVRGWHPIAFGIETCSRGDCE